jgi:hypothetical protein
VNFLLMILAAAIPAGPPPRPALAPTMVLLLILVGTLGLLLVLTLVRFSLRRASRVEREAKDRMVPESAWKMAGKRAVPDDNAGDASDDE